MGCDSSPPSRKARPRVVEKGGTEGDYEGGKRSGRGMEKGDWRRFGRRTTNRVQGGDDGGRSQEGDRRDLEQEKPGETQATVMMVAHGGADGGRSHDGGVTADSMGPTNGGGAGGGGARGSDREPKSRGEAEDPEGQGGAGGFGDRGEGGAPEGRGEAGATED